MTIWGLIIGGAAGFALGGPIGALLGAAAGHLTERKIRDQLDPEQSRKVAFTVAVIALSAKMAKADGTVTRAEIDAFRNRVDIQSDDIDKIGKFWDLARQTPDGFEAYASQTARLFGPRTAMLEQLLDLLFTIARADGDITPPEWAYLQEVAHIFGYDETEFSRLSDIYSGIHPAPHLVLDVSADAELVDVRAAWKQLARDHHPDQMIAAGMPEEFVRAATDRLSEINRAYELMSKKIAARKSSSEPASNAPSQSPLHS